MAWFRCTGGNGGGTPTFIYPKFAGIFATQTGVALKQGKWISGFASNNLFYPRTSVGSVPTYDSAKKRNIRIRFKIVGTITGDSQGLLGTMASSDRYAPQINVYPQNNTNFCVIGWSSDGSTNTTWMTFTKTEIPYSEASEYTIDAEWNNGTLKGTVSDGTNTVTKTETDGNQYISNGGKIALGFRKYNNVYATNLAVDLADTYWKEDDVLIWGDDGSSRPSVVRNNIYGQFGVNGLAILENRYLHGSSVYTEAYYPKNANGATPVLNMANAWKMHYKFKCSALVNKEQAVYGARETFYRLPNCEMQSSSNTSFLLAGWSTNGTSSDGNPFTVTKNEMPFVANQWYTIEETWDGNGTATFKVSDGTNTVTKTATKSAFATVADTSPALGRVGNADHPSTNITFDLYDCYWEQDGVILWGNKAE